MNAQLLIHAMTLVHTLIVTINAVLLNLAEPGERREMSFFKDVLGLNSVMLMPNMKVMQLNIIAHKELKS
jgi:hypothetical protein